jgi:sortase B
MSKLRIALVAILFAVAIASGIYGVYNYTVFKRGDEANEAILSNINVSEGENTLTDTLVYEAAKSTEEITYPPLDIDYNALTQLNQDFVGVIYIPVLELYQPIAHSHDNKEYLTTMFDGTKNSSGAIFLQDTCKEDFTCANTVIYGHNMRNGTMFGGLKRFRSEEGLCDQNPYVYIYTEDGVYKYLIFAYYLADKKDTCWSELESPEVYDLYIEKTIERNDYTDSTKAAPEDFSDRPNLLTLSTCYGTGHKNYTVVNAAFVGIGNKTTAPK